MIAINMQTTTTINHHMSNTLSLESKKVYIIDDDVVLCKALHWLLQSHDIEAEIYTNGFEFLKAYQTDWRGCLLIDVRMPEMTGLQLLEILKEKGNQMPIFMMSGHADVTMGINVLKAGAKDFIAKPFNDQYLLYQLQEALKLNASF